VRRPWLAAALALAACGTVRSEHVVTGPVGPPFAGEVKVVMEGAPAPARYQEVAIVTATGAGAEAALPGVLGALRREAAALGADAVIGVRYDRGAGSATATGVAVRLR
jgi:uncharacterized protein YbjQ (UPF0145 family)